MSGCGCWCLDGDDAETCGVAEFFFLRAMQDMFRFMTFVVMEAKYRWNPEDMRMNRAIFLVDALQAGDLEITWKRWWANE